MHKEILSEDELTTASESDYDNIPLHFTLSVPRFEIPNRAPQSKAPTQLKFPALPPDTEAFFSAYADQYLRFTDANPTTFHVISYFKAVLEHNGFTYVPEGESFASTKQPGLYFTVRGGLSLVAFVVGGKWSPEKGVGGIGSHVDALTLKLKPFSKKDTVDGYELLGVANYSGTLNKLWLDRDLGVGGAILVRESGKVVRKLISSLPYPIARIPSLAEHFGSVSDGPFNKESQTVPIVGYASPQEATDDEKLAPLYHKHPISLLRYIAKISGVDLHDIIELDLDLFDVQAATRGGLNNEFIFAPRIDDRLCSYAAILALIEFSQKFYSNPSEDGAFDTYDGFNAVYLTDHEEIGSATRTGARGKLLNSVVERVLVARGLKSASLPLVFANSILLSADVTHALNPNFVGEYLKDHSPLPNKGLAVKLNADQHVVTDSVGYALLKTITDKNNLELQQFQIRNDSRSGGTIGPMLATDTGARVIDVGLAQLSMHSIRATAGYKEVGLGVKTFRAFFNDWRSVYDKYERS